jgi:hypothetical protein
MSENVSEDFHPFKNIALALSGGGFRAASYSLGTLSYLQHLKYGDPTGPPLLNNVTFISSTSGGTIASCLYGYYRHSGKDFTAFYKKLLKSVLQGEDLLTLVLEKLQSDNAWDQPGNPKKRNMINSFARVYDEKIFDGKCFNVFDGNKGNLEVCFNSTEFTRGLQFRFQTDGSDKSREKAGNAYIYFDPRQKQSWQKIKLGDILAASSCFPGGFEPIIFPEDFAYKNETASLNAEDMRKYILVTDYKGEEKPLQPGKTIGLMDGGITDNQGVDSAIWADKRRRNQGSGFDLIFVTDVTSYFMDAYEAPQEKDNKGWRQQTLAMLHKKVAGYFKVVNILTLVFSLLLALSVAGFIFCPLALVKNISLVTGGISLAVVTARILLWALVLKKNKTLRSYIKNPDSIDITATLRDKLPAIKDFSPAIADKLFYYFKNTRLGILEQLLLARANSLLTMASDVFLKHVRRKIFNAFYENTTWDNRRCDNFIYELSRNNEVSRQERILSMGWDNATTSLLIPTGDMMDLAQKARNTGTTLWFDNKDTKEEKLKLLVACGQFTCCAKLLEYCIDLENKTKTEKDPLVLNEEDKKILTGIRKQLEVDWKEFKTDLFFLYKQYEKVIS